MKVLLDTHVLLWWLTDSSKLGKTSRSLLMNEKQEFYVSVISLLEINLKERKGKLRRPMGFLEEVRQQSFNTIMYDTKSAEVLRTLPSLEWNDPFDLMLIAQALSMNIPLLTADQYIQRADIDKFKVIDAGK